MNIVKYEELFAAFGKAPMDEFLKVLFKGVSPEVREQLVLDDVSYHRLSADVVTLEAWMCVEPVDSNRWIWARVEMNGSTGKIEEQFFTKDNYCKLALWSLVESIKYCKKDNEE